MRVTLFLVCASLACLNVAAAQNTALPKKGDVVQKCQGKRDFKDVREMMAKEILPNSAYRVELLGLLKSKKAEQCGLALQNYIELFQKDFASASLESGKRGFLTLALAAQFPGAVDAVLREAAVSSPEDWLAVLEREAPVQYEESLSRFVSKMAHDVRSLQNLGQTSPQAYGSASSDATSREPAKVVSPLVLERYFSAIKKSKRKLSQAELSHLNAIYAGADASYRQIFSAPMKDLAKSQTSEWIAAFRTEQVWAQVRLFPLMTEVGGPEVMRELMWLSQNHKDVRVKSLANRAIDELTER